MTPTERRILLAALLGQWCSYQLTHALWITPNTCHIAIRNLRVAGLFFVARFEHRKLGRSIPYYVLSPKGLAAAKELLQCQP